MLQQSSLCTIPIPRSTLHAIRTDHTPIIMNCNNEQNLCGEGKGEYNPATGSANAMMNTLLAF